MTSVLSAYRRLIPLASSRFSMRVTFESSAYTHRRGRTLSPDRNRCPFNLEQPPVNFHTHPFHAETPPQRCPCWQRLGRDSRKANPGVDHESLVYGTSTKNYCARGNRFAPPRRTAHSLRASSGK